MFADAFFGKKHKSNQSQNELNTENIEVMLENPDLKSIVKYNRSQDIV